MKRFGLCAFALLVAACAPEAAKPVAAPTPVASASAPAEKVPYGANKAASGTFEHDGVTLYYETYGEGDPLLVIHGNGGSIGWMAAQIDHFKANHKVIAMDSRDQGKSTDSTTPITYEKMTDDLAALLDHLKVGPVDVVGWSDGGIEALLLGVRHPDKVKKLVSMAANLEPSTQAIYPETDAWLKQMLASVPADVAKSPDGKRMLKVAGMMTKEPNIPPSLLAKVQAPTLVLAGDHDLIQLKHIVTIYEALPNAQLQIFPDSLHTVPYDNPEVFNAAVDRFLSTPFKKKARIPDTMASIDKIGAGLAK